MRKGRFYLTCRAYTPLYTYTSIYYSGSISNGSRTVN
nr:MAG TPA: hypothetical protein [Microviridae sp.]